jgi:hypothetical protein
MHADALVERLLQSPEFPQLIWFIHAPSIRVAGPEAKRKIVELNNLAASRPAGCSRRG